MSAAARRGIGHADLKRHVAVAALLWGCRILSDFPEVFISAVVQCLRFSRTSLVAFNAFQPAFSLWISLQGDRVLRFYSVLLQFGRASSSLVRSLAMAADLFPSFFAVSISTSRLVCGCSCLGSVGRTRL